MNKRKIIPLISVAAILLLSAVLGLQLLNTPSATETEEPELPDETPQVVEKPKFHIYDVDYEPTYDRVSFQMQNLGNVTATKVVVNFDLKLSSGDTIWFQTRENFTIDGEVMEHPEYEHPIITFLWIRDTVTIGNVESKETNEFYIYDIWERIVNTVGGEMLSHGHDVIILESHWNITCAEEVTETFEFY